MRLLVLYLRARRAGFALAGLLANTLFGTIAADWLIALPQLGGLQGHALIPVALLVPFVSATLIGLSLDSPSAELEQSVSYSLPTLRASQLMLLGGVAICCVMLLTLGWDHSESGWMLLRNLTGFTGLTLLTAWLLGARLSWVIPLTFAMFSLLAGRDAAGEIARWAWTVLPGTDMTGLAVTSVLLVSGVLLVVWRGPRVPTAN